MEGICTLPKAALLFISHGHDRVNQVSLQFGVTLTGNLARWVERALAYGVLRNELRFSLLLMDGMKTSCWRQRTVIKCSTALGHSLSLTTWSSLSEGRSSLFFS